MGDQTTDDWTVGRHLTALLAGCAESNQQPTMHQRPRRVRVLPARMLAASTSETEIFVLQPSG